MRAQQHTARFLMNVYYKGKWFGGAANFLRWPRVLGMWSGVRAQVGVQENSPHHANSHRQELGASTRGLSGEAVEKQRGTEQARRQRVAKGRGNVRAM